MKVVLAMAMSPNGLIARLDGQEDWLSSENWKDFVRESAEYEGIVMGRETYEIVHKLYKDYNFDNIVVENKIIISTNFVAPGGYTVISNPSESINHLGKKGITKMLLIGGGKLNSSFMTEGLVDEIHLTIDPYILGSGRCLISPAEFEYKLELISTKVLSDDRVSIKYRITK